MFENLKKNWDEIAKISHPRTMRAFALLDLSLKFGRMMMPMFPEYFSNQEGPIPLSLIRRLDAYRREYPGDDPAIYDHYWKLMGLDDSLVIRFATNEAAGIGGDFPLLPDEIRGQMDREARIGDILTLNGRQFVLLDQAKDICGLMHFGPIEWFNISR